MANWGSKYIEKNTSGLKVGAQKTAGLVSKGGKQVLAGDIKGGAGTLAEAGKESVRTYAKGIGTLWTGGVVEGTGDGSIVGPKKKEDPEYRQNFDPNAQAIAPGQTGVGGSVLVKRDEFTPYTPKTELKNVDSVTQDSSSARANQLKLLALLEQAAAGNGPSAAQAQLQAGNEANIKASMAQAASAKGPSQTAAARQSIASSATANQQTANQAAMLRAQEMQAAYGLNAQVAGDIRDTDTKISLANMEKDLQLSVDQGKISSAEAQQVYDTNARAIMQNAQSANTAVQSNADRAQAATKMDYQAAQDRATARVELNKRKNEEIAKGAKAVGTVVSSAYGGGGGMGLAGDQNIDAPTAQGSGQAIPTGSMNLAGDTSQASTTNPAEMTPQQAEQRRLVSRPTATDVRSNPQARLAMLQRLGLA